MAVDDSNEVFLTALESRIKKLVPEKYQIDVKLIKNNDKDDQSISLNVYPSSAEGNPVNCKFRKRVDGTLESISPRDMIETMFTGTCVFKVSDFFIGSLKTIRMIPKEFLVRKLKTK